MPLRALDRSLLQHLLSGFEAQVLQRREVEEPGGLPAGQPIGHDPVLRGHREAGPAIQPLRDVPGTVEPQEVLSGGRSIPHGPADRDPAALDLDQRAAMGEPDRVDREHLTPPASHDFLPELERPPCAIQPVAGGASRVVDRLAIVIANIGAGVGEGPGQLAIESDDDPRRAGQGHPGHFGAAGNLEVDFVPDRGQGELQVGIPREEREAGGGSPRGDRPVVAAHALGMAPVRRLVGRIGPGDQGERVGSSRWRQPPEVVAGGALAIGLNRLLDRAIQREERFRGIRSNQPTGFPPGEGRIGPGQGVRHLQEQIERVDRLPAGRSGPKQAILEGEFGAGEAVDPGIDSLGIRRAGPKGQRAGIHGAEVPLGGPGKPPPARGQVGVERPGAQ